MVIENKELKNMEMDSFYSGILWIAKFDSQI